MAGAGGRRIACVGARVSRSMTRKRNQSITARVETIFVSAAGTLQDKLAHHRLQIVDRRKTATQLVSVQIYEPRKNNSHPAVADGGHNRAHRSQRNE